MFLALNIESKVETDPTTVGFLLCGGTGEQEQVVKPYDDTEPRF